MTQEISDALKSLGAIVHKDGNIFFTNAAQFEAAAKAIFEPRSAGRKLREAEGKYDALMKTLDQAFGEDEGEDGLSHYTSEKGRNRTECLYCAADHMGWLDEKQFKHHAGCPKANAVPAKAQLFKQLAEWQKERL